MSLLASEFNEIQADVYKRSLKLGKRDTGVVYYDLTNYFFEWEEEGGLVQYGHCKEGRPLPIVQMGLFMDYDGFYALCTDLHDPAPAIIKLNGGRWIIENGFRVMKTDFDARPVYVRRDDRIKAHFLTCFLALLIYKYLEKKINRGGKNFTTSEIVDTLREMDFLSIAGEGYIPSFFSLPPSYITIKSEKIKRPQIAPTAVCGLLLSSNLEILSVKHGKVIKIDHKTKSLWSIWNN